MAHGSNEGMVAYFNERGFDTALEAKEMERLRKAASIFVDGLAWRRVGHRSVCDFSGRPLTAGQEREWPRRDAYDSYGDLIPANQVPPSMERATYEAAYYEAQNPGSLNAVVRSDVHVVREKFEGISFEYAAPSGDIPGPIIPSVMTMIRPVMIGGKNPYGITGVVA